jgi:ABC-2 type transport system permease protein
MKKGNFDHTFDLVRFILRRERVISTLWIVILAFFCIGLAPAMFEMFSGEGRDAYVAMIENPAMVGIMGPMYGTDDFTTGALYANAMLLWLIIAVGAMNVLLIVRHTRADEEQGRTEVVRSLPVGRLANLHAAMIAAVIINAALALATGGGIAVMGLESMGWGGSMLFGVTLGVSGLFFASVTAVFCQLAASSRGAAGLSFLTLTVAYMMRAAGDLNNEALSWASPLGLVQRGQIYVENYVWPSLILLLATVAVAVIAYALNAVRDMGQGFIPARPGRRDAKKSLCSPFGLAWRLLRVTLIVCWLSVFMIAASYGAVLDGIDEFLEQNEMYAMLIGSNPDFTAAQMFVSMVTAIMSMLALIPVLMVILKVRGEEKEGRSEHLLSRSVSRVRYISGYTAAAFAAAVLMQFGIVIGLYSVAMSVLPDPGDLTFAYLLQANMAFLPAIWVMVGLAVLIIGLIPKATPAVWAYYGFAFFAIMMGRMPGLLPEWVLKLSPFGHTPLLPVDEMNYAALAVLTVVAAALTAAGFVFYRRRDMLTV